MIARGGVFSMCSPRRATGNAPNQRVVLMLDGGESVRRLVSRIDPEAEHVLDWFHVTMRLTVLAQMTKGACPDPGWTERPTPSPSVNLSAGPSVAHTSHCELERACSTANWKTSSGGDGRRSGRPLELR
jgi:hypothetical protein